MLSRHPLEPLDADEIRAASAILRAAGHLRNRVRVIALTLHEPTRDDLRRFAAGQALDRAVFAILLDISTGETEEVIVSLTEGRVASSRRLRGAGASGLAGGDAQAWHHRLQSLHARDRR